MSFVAAQAAVAGRQGTGRRTAAAHAAVTRVSALGAAAARAVVAGLRWTMVPQHERRQQNDNGHCCGGTSSRSRVTTDGTVYVLGTLTKTVMSLLSLGALWQRGRTPVLWSLGTVFDPPLRKKDYFPSTSSDQLSVVLAMHMARWSYGKYRIPWPRWGLGLVSSLLCRSGYQGSLKGHCDHSLLSSTVFLVVTCISL